MHVKSSQVRAPLDRGRVGFDLLLVVFIGTLVISATQLRPQAALVPLIIGVPTLAGLLIRTVLDLCRWGKDHRLSEAGEELDASLDPETIASASLADIARAARAEVEADEQAPTDPAEIRRQRFFSLWVLAFVVVAGFASTFLPGILGFHTYYVPCAFVALIVIFRVIRLSWVKTIAISAGVVGLLYFLLAILLEVRL